MEDYNDNQTLGANDITDDISNAVALRSDVHSCFDELRFVFVPKRSKSFTL